MKKIFFFFLILPLFGANSKKDAFQIWNTDSAKIQLTPATTLCGSLEFRYGNQKRNIFYRHIQLQMSYFFTHYFTLTPGMRRISKRFKSDWINEYHSLFDLSLLLYHGRTWRLSNRGRLQYPLPSHDIKEKRSMIFRNCLELTFISQGKKSSVYWHVSDEIFFKKSKGWFENRIIIGFLIPRNKRSFLDVYYLYLLEKTKEAWKYQNVIGIKAELKF